MPAAKLIVMLRNPVDRAISHYFMEVRRGSEQLSLGEAIKREEEHIEEWIKIVKNENFSSEHQFRSYVSRGFYFEQLENWLKFFKNKN